jgi:hypothetical protein
MFIKRNCVWLIAATLLVSSVSKAQASPTGFLEKAQEGQKFVNEAQQVESTAKEVHTEATKFFHKPPAPGATTPPVESVKTTDVKTTDVKTTEVKTSDASSDAKAPGDSTTANDSDSMK